MASVSFTRGSKSHFFAALGAKYGFLFVEGAKQKRIYTCEQGELFLRKQVAKENISQEEADDLMQLIDSAGLALNLSDFFALVTMAMLPDEFTSQYKFSVCTDCPLPIKHGRMQDKKSGEFLSLALSTLEEGLLVVFRLLDEGSSNPLDCVAFLKEMIVAGVPIDDAQGLEMFEALTPQELEAFGQKNGISGTVMRVTIPGVGTLLVTEFTRQPAASFSETLQ